MTTELENALRTAGESNGSRGRPGDEGAPNDLMGLALKLLPRLLENAEEREELIELQKGGFSTLRKQVLLLRRELRDLRQSHAEVLQELRRMRKLQSCMVDHLARVRILELPDDDEPSDELDDAEHVPQSKVRRKPRRR